MNKRLKRIIAIIALVAMGLFSVSFVAFLIDKTLFNGGIGAFALFFGALGLALWFVLYLSRDKYEDAEPLIDGSDDESTDENADGQAPDESDGEKSA